MLIDIGELFFRTTALYKKHAKTMVMFIILFFLLGVGPVWINRGLSAGTGTNIFLLFEIIILTILGTWLPAAFIACVGHAYEEGVTAGVRNNLRATWAKLLSAFGTSIAVSIVAGWPVFIASFLLLTGLALGKSSAAGFAQILTIGSSIALIPAILYTTYRSTQLTFSMYAVVLDHKTIRGALSWSRLVTRGRWWPIFGRIVGIAFLLSLVASIPSAVFAAIGGAVNSGKITQLMNYCILLVQLCVAPLFVIAHIILYSEAKKTMLALTPTPPPVTPPPAPPLA